MTTVREEAAAAELTAAAGAAHRRHRRRRLMRAGLLPLVVTLLLVAKVTAMMVLNHTGRVAFDDGRHDDAAHAFAASGVVNLLQPWVAPYDEGTAAFRRGDYLGARELFEQALDRAPGEEQCRVRINLSLTNEILGDATSAAGKITDARTQWRIARELLAEGKCAGGSPATAIGGRLTTKLTNTRAAEDQENADAADRAAAEALRRRNQQAEEERQREQQQEQQDEPSSSPEPTPSGTGSPPVYQW